MSPAALPHPVLRHLVRKYVAWTQTPGSGPGREPPRGVAVLVVTFTGCLHVRPPRSPDRPEKHTAFLSGLHDAPASTEVTEPTAGIEVELTPVGARLLTGVAMSELTNRVVDLSAVLGSQGRMLAERLGDATGWPEKVRVLDDFHRERLGTAQPLAAGLVRAWSRLVATGGTIPITVLAEELDWEPKVLIRRFHDGIGLTPKRLARVLRFARAARLLRSGERPSLVDTALRCGYYDQAHLAREFRRLAGCTATEYLRSIPPGNSVQDTGPDPG